MRVVTKGRRRENSSDEASLVLIEEGKGEGGDGGSRSWVKSRRREEASSTLVNAFVRRGTFAAALLRQHFPR